MIKADLHIHTDISDGSLTTEEAIKIEKGLKEAIESLLTAMEVGLSLVKQKQKRDNNI